MPSGGNNNVVVTPSCGCPGACGGHMSHCGTSSAVGGCASYAGYLPHHPGVNIPVPPVPHQSPHMLYPPYHPPAPPVTPPGLEAIYKACKKLYPDQINPLQVAAIVKYWLGGCEPLDYISMYSNPGNPTLHVPPHWHYVSFGLSDLHGDGRVHSTTVEDGMSGFGFELTFRLKREPHETAPPTWPAGLMQALARYVFQTENVLCSGDHIPWHCSLDGSESRMQHMIMKEDSELQPINTKHGHVSFIQIVGVCSEELQAAQRWNGPGVLDFLKLLPGAGGPWLITDMRRGETMFDLDPSLKQQLEMGIEVDGSNLSGVSCMVQWLPSNSQSQRCNKCANKSQHDNKCIGESQCSNKCMDQSQCSSCKSMDQSKHCCCNNNKSCDGESYVDRVNRRHRNGCYDIDRDGHDGRSAGCCDRLGVGVVTRSGVRQCRGRGCDCTDCDKENQYTRNGDNTYTHTNTRWPAISHSESQQIKSELKKGLQQASQHNHADTRKDTLQLPPLVPPTHAHTHHSSSTHTNGDVLELDDLVQKTVLDSVHVTVNREAAGVLLMALRGRLRHGHHFTLKSATCDTAVTLVPEGVSGAIVDHDEPYAARGRWLQVLIDEEFSAKLQKDITRLLDITDVFSSKTYSWPDRGLHITIVPDD